MSISFRLLEVPLTSVTERRGTPSALATALNAASVAATSIGRLDHTHDHEAVVLAADSGGRSIRSDMDLQTHSHSLSRPARLRTPGR